MSVFWTLACIETQETPRDFLIVHALPAPWNISFRRSVREKLFGSKAVRSMDLLGSDLEGEPLISPFFNPPNFPNEQSRGDVPDDHLGRWRWTRTRRLQKNKNRILHRTVWFQMELRSVIQEDAVASAQNHNMPELISSRPSTTRKPFGNFTAVPPPPSSFIIHESSIIIMNHHSSSIIIITSLIMKNLCFKSFIGGSEA
jgi:hypothetical protein